MGDSDCAVLSNELIQTGLNETVEAYLQTTKYDVEIEPASKKGDNFMGIVYRAICRKSTNDKSSANLKVIVKTAPQVEQRREAFFSRQCFLREIYIFDEVLPFFREFEESKGINPNKDGFKEYPICYKTIDTAPYECLLLEDLGVDNFVMIDHRSESLTREHVNLVMAALGKFHAISFAVKDQQPTKFKQLTCDMTEIFLRPNDVNMENYVNSYNKKVIDAAALLGNAAILKKVEKIFSGNVFRSIFDYVSNESAQPYSIICHGDCWTNNTMFKLDANRKPIEVRLLDFQISRHASPVLDILYYIFCCTEKELRDQHYDSFLKVYHSSLSKHLERLGGNVDKLFPYSAMMDQLQKFGRFGLYMSILLLPILTTDVSDMPDLDQMSEDFLEGKEVGDVFKSNGSEERVNKRLGDVILDMERLGYL